MQQPPPPEFGRYNHFVDLAHFSAPKDEARPDLNEDMAGVGDDVAVLADGSTPKAGNDRTIEGNTGGQIAAGIVVQTALANPRVHGRRLVDAMTDALNAFYHLYAPDIVGDPQRTFAASFIAAALDGADLVVTRVGNVRYRINGEEMIAEEPEIDRLDAAARATEVERLLNAGVNEETALVLGRQCIQESLDNQWRLWNSPQPIDLGVGYGPTPGFGYINGLYVPDQFVHVERYSFDGIQTVEIWTDGYPRQAFNNPLTGPTLDGWEQSYRAANEVDPLRIGEYAATKVADDRSVLIIYHD